MLNLPDTAGVTTALPAYQLIAQVSADTDTGSKRLTGLAEDTANRALKVDLLCALHAFASPSISL